MEVRSKILPSGKTASSSGYVLPENPSVSTVVMVVGTLKTFAAHDIVLQDLSVDRLHAEGHLRLLIDEDELGVLRRQQFKVFGHGDIPFAESVLQQALRKLARR